MTEFDVSADDFSLFQGVVDLVKYWRPLISVKDCDEYKRQSLSPSSL